MDADRGEFRGPSAGDHVIAITLLGAFNTVVAGLLALVKGQGLPDRLYNDRAEFQRLRDWYVALMSDDLSASPDRVD